jgi:hypothetical protein
MTGRLRDVTQAVELPQPERTLFQLAPVWSNLSFPVSISRK